MTELGNEKLYCARVSIQGKVQGVGFRYFTMQQARQWEIRGWIRNRVDGSVEAVFEGTRSQIEQILAWCQEGSPTAQVNQINVTLENPSQLQGFKQRPTV